MVAGVTKLTLAAVTILQAKSLLSLHKLTFSTLTSSFDVEARHAGGKILSGTCLHRLTMTKLDDIYPMTSYVARSVCTLFTLS